MGGLKQTKMKLSKVQQVNNGTVDRSGENFNEPVITVTLPCGFNVDFLKMGLTDQEYIRRTNLIKKAENEG